MSDSKTPSEELCPEGVLRLIPEFDGASGQCVVEWLDKVELVCSLRGVKSLEGVIPLRLTGGAFNVYKQLSEAKKKSPDAIKAALQSSFGPDRFVAYEQFIDRRLRPGEAADVLVADLRKLSASFGGLPDEALGCAFVAALPENVRQLLRAGSRMDSLDLEGLLARAKAIMADEASVACVAQAHQDRGVGFRRQGDRPAIGHRRDVQQSRRCFRCRGPHLVQDCKSPFLCWRCGGQGHRARDCSEQGNDGGKACAPVAFPGTQ